MYRFCGFLRFRHSMQPTIVKAISAPAGIPPVSTNRHFPYKPRKSDFHSTFPYLGTRSVP